MEDAIIRVLAKALLTRFPKLKSILSEDELVELLTKSWGKVRNWAEVNRKSLVAVAVAFWRSVFAVMKQVFRRGPGETGPAGALVRGSRGIGGGAAALSRNALYKCQVADDIYNEVTLRLSSRDDNDEAGMDDNVM